MVKELRDYVGVDQAGLDYAIKRIRRAMTKRPRMEKAMTDTKKTSTREELDLIEEALVGAIKNSSDAELREDIKARGEDPDKGIADVDSVIAAAKAASAKRRLERAKSELEQWRAGKGKVIELDRGAMKAKFDKIRAHDPELASKMMAAARNGEGLSDSDLEGFLEDLARLERLDDDEGGGE